MVAVSILFLLSLNLRWDSFAKAQNMVRISDTGRVSEGRVDVFVDGEWQGVCDSAWDLRDATVVCRQVGYEFAVLANRNNPYGTGLLPVWRRQLHCSGNESSLSECRTSFMALCAYSAGVVCSREPLRRGSLRLSDSGVIKYGGRLEYYYEGEWATVCGNGWSQTHAQVAYTQIGIPFVQEVRSDFPAGSSSHIVMVTDVTCNGEELRFSNCSGNVSSAQDCEHSMDIGITCTVEEVSSGTPEDSSVSVVGIGVGLSLGGLLLIIVAVVIVLTVFHVKCKPKSQPKSQMHGIQTSSLSRPGHSVTSPQPTTPSSLPPAYPGSSDAPPAYNPSVNGDYVTSTAI